MATTATDNSPAAELGDRSIGWIIAIASAAAVAMMAHHPMLTSSGMDGLVAETARKAQASRFVHGALIAVLGLLLFGFSEYSRRAGAPRPWLRAALLAYATGVAASIGAALINGFVVPGLSLRYAGAGADQLEFLRHSLRLCRHANQALADTGEAARALAVLLWSGVLLRSRRSVWLGVAGIAIGAAVLLAILSGALELDLRGEMLAVLAAAGWNVALAAQLLRGKL